MQAISDWSDSESDEEVDEYGNTITPAKNKQIAISELPPPPPVIRTVVWQSYHTSNESVRRRTANSIASTKKWYDEGNDKDAMPGMSDGYDRAHAIGVVANQFQNERLNVSLVKKQQEQYAAKKEELKQFNKIMAKFVHLPERERYDATVKEMARIAASS
jgi:hypothetical protein